MDARKLIPLGLLLAVCALTARYQRPEPLPEAASPPAFPHPVVGELYVLEHLQGRLQVRLKGKPDGVVWSEFERNPNHGYWSPDGTHLALFQTGRYFQLRVWTLHEVRAYRGEFFQSEGPFEIVIAPDNGSLLLRVARTQGMFDYDLGQLYSVDLRSGQNVYWEETVRKMEWLDSHRFRCWVQSGEKDPWVQYYDVRNPPHPRRHPPEMKP